MPQPTDGLAKSFEVYHNHEEDEDSNHDGDTLYRNPNFLFDIAQALKRSCLHVIPTLPVGANSSRSDVSTVQNEYKNRDDAKNELKEKETDMLFNVHAVLSEKQTIDATAAPLPPVLFPGTRETKAGTEITDVFDREHYTTVRTILRPRPSFFNMSKFRSGGSDHGHGHAHAASQTDSGCADSLRARVLSSPTSPCSRIGFHLGSLNCLSTDAFEEQIDVIQEERAREIRGETIEIFCEKTLRVVQERVSVACAAR